MRYIQSPSNDAFFNMALEEYVFEGLCRAEEWFMLWQNKNAIVVGKYQNTAQEINPRFVEENGIQVVRRLSGGGAMYQDMGNLNFTFVVNAHGAKSIHFDSFTRPVVRALAAAGVKAEAGDRNDILIDGKKFSGNSQYNKNGRTMHHGTLLYSSNLSVLGRALKPRPDKMEARGVKSVRSRVANISDAMAEKRSMADFKALLVREMFAENSLEPYRLTPADLAAIEKLRNEKYATWEWNYGRSPAYGLRREARYPFGGLTLHLQADKGRIKALAIEGDFFGNGELAELYAALSGLPLRRPDILEALAGIDVGHYIHGFDAEGLAALLLG